MAWAGTALPLRDIGGEVAWIISAQTADFDFCEHGYDLLHFVDRTSCNDSW